MEALIHHFKLVTEGFRVPPGEIYYPIESPRGELACFVRSDGSSKPARVHMRDPSFVNLQALSHMAEGSYIADMIATLAMLDPILGGIDRWNAVRKRRARARASRDGTSRPTRQGPGAVPTPPSRCPPSCAPTSRRTWRSIPTVARLHCRHWRRAARAWLVLTRGDRASRRGDGRDAGLPCSCGDASTTCWRPSPSASTAIYVCTNISCSLRGADALHAAVSEAAGDDPEFNVRSFECLGACDIAPMASVDGVFVGPLTLDDVPQLLDDIRAGRPVLPDKQLSTRLWPTRMPTRVSFQRTRSRPPRRRTPPGAASRRPPGPPPPSRSGVTAHDRSTALQGHRRARPRDARRVRQARRLRVAAQGARDHARGRARPARSLRPARSRRGRLCDGQEGVLPAQRHDRQVPRVQRGRVRARHVQGPRTDAEVAAHADRGD